MKMVLAAVVIASLTFGGMDSRSDQSGYGEIAVVFADTAGDPPGSDRPVGLFFVSDVIERRFDLAGLLWSGPGDPFVLVRTRSRGGWSNWVELGSHAGDGRSGSDPVWARESDSVQFAISELVLAPKVGLVRSGELANGNSGPELQQVEQAGGTGFVTPRTSWDTNGCADGGDPPAFADVRGIVIHHTTSSNSYSPAEVPNMIASICSFHVNGRGWNDIGYNFVVDRFGTVWEARAGGVLAGIQGAHASGFNTWTQGVALLGSYDTVEPSQQQLAGLDSLLEVLTGWFVLDPVGEVTLVSQSDASLFPIGTEVVLPVIMAHLDVVPTSCPGSGVHGLLGAVRTGVTPGSKRPDESAGDELLVSNAASGWLGMAELRADGSRSGSVSSQYLLEQWSVVEDVQFDADPQSELLFYSAADGSILLTELAPAGDLVGAVIADRVVGVGWDSVEPVDLDGDGVDELFFYRRSNGRFVFYDLRPDGSLGSAVRVGFFAPGWTSVEPIDIDGDGDDEMMFYRSSDGRFSYYNLRPSGGLGNAIRVGNLAPGWTVLEPIDLTQDGNDEMMFYRSDTGRKVFYTLSTSGFLGSALSVGFEQLELSSIASPQGR